MIHTHPRVGMVGVVGLPDSRTSGERLVAFVVCQPGEAVNDAEISAYCASRLVSYRCPSEVFVVDRLSMTGNQKLDRIALWKAADHLAPQRCGCVASCIPFVSPFSSGSATGIVLLTKSVLTSTFCLGSGLMSL